MLKSELFQSKVIQGPINKNLTFSDVKRNLMNASTFKANLKLSSSPCCKFYLFSNGHFEFVYPVVFRNI